MAAPSWAPTIAQVGAILNARTRQEGTGALLGTFTTETVPTATQVDSLIENACNDVLAEVGTIPTELEANAGSVAAWGTAMIVELSFYPSQVGDDNDIYAALEKQYNTRLMRLKEAAKDYNAVQTDGIGEASFADSGFPRLIGTSLTEDY